MVMIIKNQRPSAKTRYLSLRSLSSIILIRHQGLSSPLLSFLAAFSTFLLRKSEPQSTSEMLRPVFHGPHLGLSPGDRWRHDQENEGC